MLFLKNKNNRLQTYNDKQKKHLNISTITDKSFYSHSLKKQNQSHSQTPLLSFTSFQHYLQECNQTQFYKKQHEKYHRSANITKTQAYFTYQRQKSSTSQTKRQKYRNITLSDSKIEPFKTSQQSLIKNGSYGKNRSSNRNINSKSVSQNYLSEKHTIAYEILNQKFGTIQGWDSQNKCQKIDKSFGCKNILQQRKYNNTKNRNYKSSQNSFYKQKKNRSSTEISQFNKQGYKKHLKSKQLENKQNIFKTEMSQKTNQRSLSQDQLFYPIQIIKKIQTKKNPLTSINELQQQILLSKRQPYILGSSSNRYNQDQELLKNKINKEFKQNSNIKLLKTQFQYLCKNDFQQEPVCIHKSTSGLLQHSNSKKKDNKSFKPFKRFPKTQNKQNITCYTFNPAIENSIQANRPKTTDHQIIQSSPSMLKILQSINLSSNEKYSYQPKTPIHKNKKTPNNQMITPKNKKNQMKSLNQQKQKFHQSIKDRKNPKNFDYGSLTQGPVEQNFYKNKNDNQSFLMINVVNSFLACDSKIRNKSRKNYKNYSLLKSIKSRFLTEQQTQKLQHLISMENAQNYSTSVFKDTTSNNNQMHNLHNFEEQKQNQSHAQSSLSISVDLIHKNQSNDNSLTQPNQQNLQNLKFESQNLKCGTRKQISILEQTKNFPLNTNKKFMYLKKANKIHRQRNNISKKMGNKQHNFIQNLNITQLEGHHIQKLRKRLDIQ